MILFIDTFSLPLDGESKKGRSMKSLNYALVSSLCALVIGILLVVRPDIAVNYLIIAIGALFFDSRVGGDVELFFLCGRQRVLIRINGIFLWSL